MAAKSRMHGLAPDMRGEHGLPKTIRAESPLFRNHVCIHTDLHQMLAKLMQQ